MRKEHAILLLLIGLNIVVRIPVLPIEMGGDSNLIHWMSDSIIIEGEEKWVIHQASVFGWYPYSYPSAVPLLNAIFSIIFLDFSYAQQYATENQVCLFTTSQWLVSLTLFRYKSQKYPF